MMIRRLFTDIAGVYDRLNHLLSLGQDRRWRRIAVGMAQRSPRRILDLACGTGDLTFALARRFLDAAISGVDFTPAMLDRARTKAADSSDPTPITFVEGDAQRLSACEPPIDASAFDLVTCAFGFRNFPDPSAVLAEVRRALVTDGELIVLEFFRPTDAVLGALTALWLRLMTALFARGHASAYRHLRKSMRTTLTEQAFADLARTHGLTLAERRFLWPCCTCLRMTAAPTPG